MSVDMVRATMGAGRLVAFVDHVSPGNGLGVRPIGSPPNSDALVELAGHCHRANLGTITTAGATLQVDVTRLSPDGDLKTPRLTGYMFHLREGEQFDVQVPADLDQFGRDDSHGAIVGGEGLVQLGHDPADGSPFLYQIYFIARIGKVKGCLHPGDAAADHHDRAHNILGYEFLVHEVTLIAYVAS